MGRHRRQSIYFTFFKPILIKILVFWGDITVIGLAYAAAYVIRFKLVALFPAEIWAKWIPPLSVYLRVAPLLFFIWAVVLWWQNAYRRLSLTALDELVRVFRISLLGTLLTLSALFIYKEVVFSRLFFLMSGISCGVFLYLWREALKLGYLAWIRNQRQPKRVMVIGSGYLSTSVRKILRRLGDRAVLRRSRLDVESLRASVVRSRIDEVLIADPLIDHREAVKLASFCDERGVELGILPDILELRMGEVVIDDSLGLPVIQVKSISLHGSAFALKRIVDIALSFLVLTLLSGPLILIAGLIKLTSPGPVFYKQKRVGYKGQEFNFLKFRTMIKNAESMLNDLKDKNERGDKAFKMKFDPRVTWIGRFLRRTSLDEIPQLLNVLKGEMSLVGPRPQVPWEFKLIDDWARKRLNVLPGITGLWQVSGRADLTFEEMIDLDIYYIEHWSLGLDLKIMLKTLPAIFSAKGAY